MADEIRKVSPDVTLTIGTGVPPPRKVYEVVSLAGLFKAGNQYAKGEQIELDVQCAANFLSNNDIKEVQS
jgi:hypothetical protein